MVGGSRYGAESGREMALSEQVRLELVSLLPRLRRFGFALTGSMDDGDDLVQSALERALTRLDAFEPGTRLDSWMYRIMQNMWVDLKRSAQSRREISAEPADIEPLVVGDARRELEGRLFLAAVRRAVADLPAEQRSVLAVVCVEGLSYREAAAVLDIPIGTVMSRLSRARLAVGQAIGEGTTAGTKVQGRTP
jgi:RNA polymerase sigma-70 factor, ECF subfamily